MRNIVQLVIPWSQHSQNGNEQVQDVQIESDGGQYVIIICEALDQVVSVIDYVSTENQGTNSTIDGSRCWAKWEEHLHNNRTYIKSDESYIYEYVEAQVII